MDKDALRTSLVSINGLPAPAAVEVLAHVLMDVIDGLPEGDAETVTFEPDTPDGA